jgi:hypothetical protein
LEAIASVVIAGCASTTVVLAPSPQPPVCNATAAALVLWAPQWRPDQKDAAEREAAASAGLEEFIRGSGCFARAELRRALSVTSPLVSEPTAAATGQFDKVVVIAVRELGPVVKLLSSASLIEGGTQVVLQVEEYALPGVIQRRAFTVQWQNGGPGVVKGVASLPRDMQAALVAGMQPSSSK